MSLALLSALAEHGAATALGILEGPRTNIGKAYDQLTKLKTVAEHYEILKNAKENSFRTALWRLVKKGLVEKHKNQYRLSMWGHRIVRMNREKMERKPWDGKWRLVTFDVPEKQRFDRDWLRAQLAAARFRPIQKSVFLGKWALPESVFGEIQRRNLSPHIRLVIIGAVDDETIFDGWGDSEGETAGDR